MSPAANTPDFQTLFEAVPGLYFVLDRGLCIVAISDACAVCYKPFDVSALLSTIERLSGRNADS